MAAKKKTATSKLPPGIPDRAVDHETLMRFFVPPVGKSTFYNLVRKGTVVKIKEVQGYYLLNESLVRLGLPPVSDVPANPDAALREIQLVTLALYLVAPDIVPSPSWGLTDDRLTAQEKSHVALLAMHHHQKLQGITLQPQRLAYVEGTLDACEKLCNPPPPRSARA